MRADRNACVLVNPLWNDAVLSSPSSICNAQIKGKGNAILALAEQGQAQSRLCTVPESILESTSRLQPMSAVVSLLLWSANFLLASFLRARPSMRSHRRCTVVTVVAAAVVVVSRVVQRRVAPALIKAASRVPLPSLRFWQHGIRKENDDMPH